MNSQLKSAEDWYLESDMLRGLKWRPETVIDYIKQIRLDSFKAGMAEAAEIAEKHYEDQTFNAMYRQAGFQIGAVILSARDRKESL